MNTSAPRSSAAVSEPRASGPPRALLLEIRPASGGEAGPGLFALGIALRAFGFCIDKVATSTDALASIAIDRPALVLIELRAGDGRGFAAFESVVRHRPDLTIFVCSEHPTVPEAVHVVKAGAHWYGATATGVEFERALQAVLETPLAAQGSSSQRRGRALGQGSRIVGCSEAINKTLGQAALVAPTRTTVLLLGETGTGKERLAQAIHEASPRRQGPFVAVNCAALAEGLLESELFGHEKGAFSGAHSRREGRFGHADGGTIFLDEVGEVTLSTQVKLLRVLQERKFERVGGSQTLSVDVRVIAATNRNLREMVEERTFRADLFYRLNVMTIELPPLRERREDIPLLVAHLVPRLALEMGLPECEVAPGALRQLVSFDWPGNVRELENTLQRALVMAEGAVVEHFDLLPSRPHEPPSGARGPRVPGASFREIERHAIMTTYEACGRSPVRTAEVLGISPRTVHYRLREYRGDPGRRTLRPDGGRTDADANRPESLGALGDAVPLHLVRSGARAAGTADEGLDKHPGRRPA